MGRPQALKVVVQMLERAVQVFWEQDYEGSSLTDLTRAMGISRTSLYAASGNKDDLFRQALERYTKGPAAYGARALQKPTARGVATAFLTGSVRASTRPDCPAGCLGGHGSLAAGAAARDALTAWRNEGVARLYERFQEAVAEGDLPPNADPALLARYVMTVSNGIAVQAASGATRDDLQRVADAALSN